jgi:hypothetical protein
MGKRDEDGAYMTITQVGDESKQQKKEQEQNKPPQPSQDPQPPHQSPPAAEPEEEFIDEFKIEEIARQHLPSAEDAADYASMAAEGVFSDLASRVVQDSGLVTEEVGERLKDLAEEVAGKEDDLNRREAPLHEDQEQVSWDPLPGVRRDEACMSVFDVNDLALRGQKAVRARHYNRPLMFPETFIGGGPTPDGWLFGQKLEYQQEWRHEGFTLGELVSSMSLLPNEELTVEVSSWQRTKQEIQQEEDDTKKLTLDNEQRNTDERSCTNEVAASNDWSVSASGAVEYPGASASLSASVSGSVNQRSEESRNGVRQATTRATSEVSARRAIKLTQTTEAGSEQTTTRRITNPNTCHTVTFNFFQVIKLYDVQMRLVGDAPMLLLPAIFPRYYGTREDRRGQSAAPPTEVQIPYHIVEGFREPAAFLTRYFEVDRELSRLISGWAFRIRLDVRREPASVVAQLAEALVVGVKYLFREDPQAHTTRLSDIVRHYVEGILQLRADSVSDYGPDLGSTEQVATPGIYVDSMLGHCTGCEDYVESSRYVDVMRQQTEREHLEAEVALLELERQRRTKLLAKDELEPFEAMVPQ